MSTLIKYQPKSDVKHIRDILLGAIKNVNKKVADSKEETLVAMAIDFFEL